MIERLKNDVASMMANSLFTFKDNDGTGELRFGDKLTMFWRQGWAIGKRSWLSYSQERRWKIHPPSIHRRYGDTTKTIVDGLIWTPFERITEKGGRTGLNDEGRTRGYCAK